MSSSMKMKRVQSARSTHPIRMRTAYTHGTIGASLQPSVDTGIFTTHDEYIRLIKSHSQLTTSALTVAPGIFIWEAIA